LYKNVLALGKTAYRSPPAALFKSNCMLHAPEKPNFQKSPKMSEYHFKQAKAIHILWQTPEIVEKESLLIMS